MTVAVRLLADQVWAHLQAVANVNHYRGQVDDPPHDADGKVHAYTVLYAGSGRQFSNRLNAHPGSLAWSFQITCVGGDDNRALWCVDKVRDTFTGLLLPLESGKTGRVRETTDPGPIRRDDDIVPARFYLPLLFGVHVVG